jgi:hypothetical protein
MGGGSTRTITVTDEFWALNPTVSFLNYAKTFYLDLGYAQSNYQSDDNSVDDIDVRQWAPTLGIGFNRAYDWVQMRAYFISLSNSNRVAGKDGTSALEVKYTHWYTADAPLNLHSLRFTVLSGERIYAVDSDACSLCNVTGLQTGVLSIGAEWKINEQSSVRLQGALETYENVLISDKYSSNNIFVYGSRNW